MSTASVTTPALLTAEEFAQRPDPGYPEELVRGRIVPLPMPKPRHGEICNRVGRILGDCAEDRDLGRVLSNDTGVITERGPDTVRGADISFYSFARVPKGPLPDRYLDTPPDLVVEVLSPSDRWPKVLAKGGGVPRRGDNHRPSARRPSSPGTPLPSRWHNALAWGGRGVNHSRSARRLPRQGRTILRVMRRWKRGHPTWGYSMPSSRSRLGFREVLVETGTLMRQAPIAGYGGDSGPMSAVPSIVTEDTGPATLD